MSWLGWGQLCWIWRRQVLPSSIVVGHRHHSQHRRPRHRRKRPEDHDRGRVPKDPGAKRRREEGEEALERKEGGGE